MSDSLEAKFASGLLVVLHRDRAKEVFGSRDPSRLMQVLEDIVSSAGDSDVVSCDGHWKILHRVLGDGSLTPDGGDLPLNQCVLGGRPLDAGDAMTVRLVRPDMVVHIATALAQLTSTDLESRFETAVAAADSAEEANLEIVTLLVDRLRSIFEAAARDRAAVAFCARHID